MDVIGQSIMNGLSLSAASIQKLGDIREITIRPTEDAELKQEPNNLHLMNSWLVVCTGRLRKVFSLSTVSEVAVCN